MSIDKTQLKKIASLAKLDIKEENISIQMNDFNNLLNMIEAMNQLDTTDVPPMAHPLQVTQPLRDDVVSETNQRELLQHNAPDTADGLYLVPQVIES